jgi:hypothetical protein
MPNKQPSYQDFLLSIERNQISNQYYSFFETSIQSILQTKVIKNKSVVSTNAFIENLCSRIPDSICKIQTKGKLNQNISNISVKLIDLMLFLSFEYYPNFLTKMLSLIQQKDHSFFQILSQHPNQESWNRRLQSSQDQLYLDFCSRFTNQQFFESALQFLESTENPHLFTLLYLDQLYHVFQSNFDQNGFQIIFQSILICIIKVYKSKDQNLLNDQELFRKVIQRFSNQEFMRNIIVEYLISQMPKNLNFVLNEIKFMISSDIEKESTIHHLSTIEFFDGLLNNKQSQYQRLILEILSSALPFYHIPINNLLQLFNNHIDQPYYSFKELIPQWKFLLFHLPSSYFLQFFISILSDKNTSSKQQFLSEILESISTQDHLFLPLHQLYFEQPSLRKTIFPVVLKMNNSIPKLDVNKWIVLLSESTSFLDSITFLKLLLFSLFLYQ